MLIIARTTQISRLNDWLQSSDVNKAISIKAKAKAGPFQGQAKAKCLQEQDKPPPV